MRIAVSGSHSLGKSTLVDDWVARYPQFTREEEPYRALGLYGPYQILFRDESTNYCTTGFSSTTASAVCTGTPRRPMT
jgi:hypothetical protein